MSRKFSRRNLLKGTGVAVAGALAAPYILRAAPLNAQKIRVAFVGTDGQAGAHLHLAKEQICPCYADVDPNRWGKIAAISPDAKSYTDYREMFDKHEKDIDAVVVTTPDHTHFPASIRAIKAGKHCYTEKPLTWAISEARRLAEATKEKKVATQMGNMAHNSDANCTTIEFIQAGAIGDIIEIHTTTNRPVWPQGTDVKVGDKAMPKGMNWDVWIGAAPEHAFIDGVHPFKWRGWLNYGCGAIGDMGCHTWDAPFNAMDPDYPTEVELLEIEGSAKDVFPKKSHFMWTFPAKGNRPGYKAHWYSGDMKVKVPDGAPVPRPSATLYVGTKGFIMCQGDYGGAPQIYPDTAKKAFTRPAQTLRRANHKGDWVAACKGEKPFDFPASNFMNGGALTEVLLLGALTERLGQKGIKLECDPVKREVKTQAYKDIMDREPRKGFAF